METPNEILLKNTGHAHGLMDYMVLISMKEYAMEAILELDIRLAMELNQTGTLTGSQIFKVMQNLREELALSPPVRTISPHSNTT